jgi:arsenite-transporting ATPase
MQVLQFVQGEEYARFTRIVFDTAPTGHTLRLLTVPDFVEASLARIVRLRKRLGSASQVRGLGWAGLQGRWCGAQGLVVVLYMVGGLAS